MLNFGLGVRLPVTLRRVDQPGDEDMHRFALAKNLYQALRVKGTRRLLSRSDTKLGSDPNSLTTHRLTRTLPVLMVLAAWRHNVEYFEKRLNASRHDAIARPSLETFNPLTLLRRNIAHLEEAVSAARENIYPSEYDMYAQHRQVVNEELKSGEDKYGRLQKANNSELESLDDHYDALLQRIKTMSTTLNNEIQLVIGSVTVQVRSYFLYTEIIRS